MSLGWLLGVVTADRGQQLLQWHLQQSLQGVLSNKLRCMVVRSTALSACRADRLTRSSWTSAPCTRVVGLRILSAPFCCSMHMFCQHTRGWS